MVLVDADIMIDVLRGLPAAMGWLASLGSEEVALPGYVLLELLDGESDRMSMARTRRRLQRYRVLWPKISDYDRAVALFAEAKLTHGLDAFDALIAEMAKGMRVPLHTFNTRHFSAVPGLRTVQPYRRPQ
ncbi:MAG: type II toxin-antitoxin system VapC family toxin [Planctomycetes bacterium]|nr:type II toxin-antitoxin system VapC family toxin [Planctomycetota bacterium]